MPAGLAAVLLAALACGSVEAPPTAVSRDPAATALVSGIGLASRLVDPAASDVGAAPPVLWLLPPSAALPDALPGDAHVLRVDRTRLDPLFAAARSIGAALQAEPLADAWIEDVQLGLAGISASSLGEKRPHVGVVLGTDPVTLAGGPRLETELVEIAGAESVTHGMDALLVALDRLPEEHRAPDLWLWIGERAPTAAARAQLRSRLPETAMLDVFELPETWLADPVGHVARLRARIRAIPPR